VCVIRKNEPKFVFCEFTIPINRFREFFVGVFFKMGYVVRVLEFGYIVGVPHEIKAITGLR